MRMMFTWCLASLVFVFSFPVSSARACVLVWPGLLWSLLVPVRSVRVLTPRHVCSECVLFEEQACITGACLFGCVVLGMACLCFSFCSMCVLRFQVCVWSVLVSSPLSCLVLHLSSVSSLFSGFILSLFFLFFIFFVGALVCPRAGMYHGCMPLWLCRVDVGHVMRIVPWVCAPVCLVLTICCACAGPRRM